MTSVRTVVHLVRHGEVYNPDKILYGRLPGYHLSDRGRQMATIVADHLAGRDVAHVISSSLTRARETAAPIAARHTLHAETDDRVIEAANDFEGSQVTLKTFLDPRALYRYRDPRKPSWGEPYAEVAARMSAAITDARAAARGREAVIVSHQMPIWIARAAAEGRRLWHDPRSRECSLASVTSFTYADDRLTAIAYAEPARALLSDETTSVGA
ncbi:MAG: histidine phosphatase family protein [Tetrasphaera sp.]|jgi:broad specificity phosphatase PhoE|nr:histidine phosphatase family protein [Tetrasphaera sp.]